MAKITYPDSRTVDAIYQVYEKRPRRNRPHLGGSQIGHECLRYLWYQFRWCFSSGLPGRVLRLFETGHLQEERVVSDLRSIGAVVYATDGNDQFTFKSHGDHFSCSLDGVLKNLPEAPKTWHLLEIKTHSEKSFNALRKHGVKRSKPQHWAQMQVYMLMAELDRALYFAVNKNTDALYTERLELDKSAAKKLLDDARKVIESPVLLTKAGESESFVCKFCDASEICHGDKVADINCRTCVHATPLLDTDGAQWKCELHDKLLSTDEQRDGCKEHLIIPPLIPFAEPVDSGEGWIRCRIDDGREFVVCGETSFPAQNAPCYSSIEVRALGIEKLCDETIELVRQRLEGEVIE